MGSITYSDAVAIAQIVYYSPAFLAAIFLCIRHGFEKSSGWYFLITFCLTRLIGASGQLATINSPTSDTAITIALVCSVIGTSPLLLSSLGLISRIYYSILKNWSFVFQYLVIRAIQVAALVALIMSIVGATSVKNIANVESNTEVHVAIILFLLVFIAIVVLTTIAVCFTRRVPDQDRIILRVVVIALPFIFVKILYSLLAAFSHSRDFNFVTGSKTIELCMSVLMEMIVVALYVFAGFWANSTPLPANTSTAETIGYRAGRGDFQPNKRGLLSLGLGVASAAGKRGAESSRRNQQRADEAPSYSAV